MENGPEIPDRASGRVRETARLFLQLGTIAFGGPAAHIAMMDQEVVRKRGWLTREQFLDLLGATNLIPGPNSTEMAIHIGYLRAGWRGLLVAGACFILPAMTITGILAWAYVRYGALPEVGWLLYGVKPVIIAIVFQALWGFAAKAITGPVTGVVGAAAMTLSFFGWDEVLLLLLGGLAVMCATHLDRRWKRGAAAAVASGSILGGGSIVTVAAAIATVGAAVPVSLWALTGFFLKVGSVLFGSGYVLLAFLRGDLVQRWGWLTDQQLMDAIAVGQFTPGPVLTTATFIGYLIAGTPGALLATLAIFLPSFVFVAASSPLIPRMRRSAWAGSFLDGVTVASLGLMTTVTWQLGRAALVDGITLGTALVATVLVFRLQINSAWLVLGGAAVGLGMHLFR
jgi:chromate transporter